MPFENGKLAASQVGNRLIITHSGLGINLSSTQYLSLTVPQLYDATASGLCENFNEDKYDDMLLRDVSLKNFAELLHSWAVIAPRQLSIGICGRECDPVHPAICEDAGCGPGQQCALRDAFWGCHDRPEVCKLWDGLHISTLGGQQLNLEPGLSYSLMSLCDEVSAQLFSLISYRGQCDSSSSRLVTVFQIFLRGLSVAILERQVKVNRHSVSLPSTSPSGLSLSSGVNQDKSDVIVILRRNTGMDSELEMKIGVTMVTVKVPLWYSGKLYGLCGNLNDLHSHSSVKSWVLHDFPVCRSSG